jgi:hypothetical protein
LESSIIAGIKSAIQTKEAWYEKLKNPDILAKYKAEITRYLF